MRVFLLPFIICGFVLIFPTHAQVNSVGPTNKDSTHLSSFYVVKNIQVKGNKKTRTHIVLRELSFQAGDTLLAEGLSEFFLSERNKVFNTQLFNAVNLLYALDTGELEVTLELDERWYIWPSIQIDFGDRNFNEWIQRGAELQRLVFGLSFTDKNFRGRMEKLTLRAQVGFTRKFEVFYDLPYIDKKRKTGIGFKVSYSENDQVAYETRDNWLQFTGQNDVLRKRFYGQFGIERRNRFYSRHNVNLGYHNYWVGDTIVDLNPNYFSDSIQRLEFAKINYTYTYDVRNIAFYPTKGHMIEAGLEKEGLGLFGPLDVWKINVNGSKFYTLSRRFSSGHYASLFTSLPRESIPYFTYGGLGYRDDILRGFDLYVVNARSYALIKNELRFMLFSFTRKYDKIVPVKQFQTIPASLFLKAFVDFGTSEDPFTANLNPLFADKNLWAAGLGLDFATFYDLVFRLEYSRISNGENNVFLNLHAAF